MANEIIEFEIDGKNRKFEKIISNRGCIYCCFFNDGDDTGEVACLAPVGDDALKIFNCLDDHCIYTEL